MDDLNFYCNVHNSPIGGICSDLFCKNSPLMCILCAVDENSCVKNQNHELITFEEFFLKFENQLNVKFSNRNLNCKEFLNILKRFNFEEARKEYATRKKDRNEIIDNYFMEMKDKILEIGMNSKVDKVIEKMREPINQVREVKVMMNNMKSKGFDIVEEKSTDSFNENLRKLCKNYPELNIDKLKLLEEDEIEEKITKNNLNINENISDYKFLQKLILLLKYSKEENRVKEIKTKFEQFKSITEYFKENNLEDYKNQELNKFNKALLSLETDVPKLSNNILKLISLNFKQNSDNNSDNNSSIKDYGFIKKFMSKDLNNPLANSEFSYHTKELFNTSHKQPYCILEPTQLKLLFTLVKDSQIKNTLMDMMVIFKTKAETEFLAYSSNKDTVNIINMTKEKLNNNMSVTVLPKINTGTIYKLEHYQSQDGIDYLITVSSDKTINKYEYSPQEQKFNHKKTIKLKALTYSIEIVVMDKIPYLFAAPYNAKIVQLNFSDFSLYRNFEPAVNNYVYSMKAFYHKYLDQHFIVLSTHDSIQVFEIKTGTLFKTIKCNESCWYFSSLVIENPNREEKDYYIVANIQKNVGIFSFGEGKLIRKMNASGTILFRAVEVWNEKYVCVGTENSKVHFYDMVNGDKVCELADHTKSIGGVKRYYLKDFGDILFSFSTDGSIKVWSY